MNATQPPPKNFCVKKLTTTPNKMKTKQVLVYIDNQLLESNCSTFLQFSIKPLM